MQISKSSQNTNKNSQIAFLIAAAIHLPFVLLAMGIDLLPQKPQEPAKELGAMSFSLASFVAEPIEPAIMPTPEIQEIPKYYEPPKKKLNEKKNVQQKPKHLEHKQKTYKNTEQSHAKMTNAALNQDSSMQNHNQAINLGSNHQNPFLAEIKRLIDAHNSYPRMARRMGLSGEVVVRMVLDSDGKIVELRVIESSTHAILDEQTMHAIQEASRLFPKPDKAYILHIPIVYQLNRG